MSNELVVKNGMTTLSVSGEFDQDGEIQIDIEDMSCENNIIFINRKQVEILKKHLNKLKRIVM